MNNTTPTILQKAKTAYSLWFQVMASIPKTHRYLLAGKVEHYFLELLECIFTTLYLPIDQKPRRIEMAISKLNGVKFFIQICWENKCISNKNYLELSEKFEEIGRILGGWKKGLESKTPAGKREK